uniref:Uncharacterized protein n=1 Tax=Brassica oleracea var. oleracea TaxID=109376 RepID=A0A0D3BQP3_BRAOL
MDVPKDQIATLMEHGLYDSAEMLGCFLVSSSTVSAEASPHLKAETLILLGDALFHRREYRRAIHTYKQALHHCARVPKQSSGISRSSLSLSTRSSVNASSVSSINENEVRFKIASSHFALSETKAAIAEMESVKTRSLEMNVLMAKLHRNSGYNRGAIAFYKECLRQCPYVLEAIIGLAELGATAKDIISAFTQTSSRSTKVSLDQIDPTRWLQRYVEAQCCVASHAYKGALELFAELLQRFPNNVHLLTETAKVEAIIGKNDEAIMRFEKVRSIDPYTLTCMDEYAMLLQMKCDYSRLNKLVHDLLSIDHTRAEVFVALSVLWERKDPRTALSYAEKSIRVDERHIPGYIVKGNFLLLAKRPEAAAIAFRAAQNLRSDLRSYQGLVHSYLAFGKTKEALYTAREAMNAMPQSAKALKLVGDVHANTSSGREKAKKFYESALRLEPGYLGAAIALADLHLMEGRNGDAVSLLERYLKDWADESLHVKLAQVFAATNMLQDSLSHYQAALRINPQNEAAKKGLDRLEKQMKGIDPDAADENDENDVEDVDGDTEEAELISRIPSTLFSKQSTLASLYSLNKFALRREYKLSFSLSLSTTSSMIVTPIHASSSSSSTIGETSDGLKVQSHVSIGANDLLIVGAGVLGRLVAEKWREEHPDCQIIGQTVTINHHNELEKLGIKPALKETEFDGKFSYVIFCAPPSQSPDYAAELRTAASKWNGEGSFLFTSSSAPFDCFDNGECNEDSPVVPLGKSPRTDVLLRAEQVVLEKTRGAHNYWLNKETVEARPDHILNLIHYEDAASLAVAIMKKKAGGRIFLGCDNHPLSRQEVMDLMDQSGKYDKKFKGFTSTSGPLGKKLNNSRTRVEIGWEPNYPSFAQFLGVTK